MDAGVGNPGKGTFEPAVLAALAVALGRGFQMTGGTRLALGIAV
jgi:hypothetical protein